MSNCRNTTELNLEKVVKIVVHFLLVIATFYIIVQCTLDYYSCVCILYIHVCTCICRRIMESTGTVQMRLILALLSKTTLRWVTFAYRSFTRRLGSVNLYRFRLWNTTVTGVLCSTHYMTWSFVLGFWHKECERPSVSHSGSYCTVSWSKLSFAQDWLRNLLASKAFSALG